MDLPSFYGVPVLRLEDTRVWTWAIGQPGIREVTADA